MDTNAGGRFFAPQFQARATWELTEDKRLMIDWVKFGKYDLAMKGSSPPEFEVVTQTCAHANGGRGREGDGV